MDENVTPVVEELRRRLRPVSANCEDHATSPETLVHNDVETGEEDGMHFNIKR